MSDNERHFHTTGGRKMPGVLYSIFGNGNFAMQLVIIPNKKAYKSYTYRLFFNSIHAAWGRTDSIRQ